MITSVKFHEFWMMGTQLINTRNIVAFLMALGVTGIAPQIVMKLLVFLNLPKSKISFN